MTTGRERALNRLLRRVRYGGYRTLQPIDSAFRWLNGLERYPPIALRRQVGLLGFVDGPGYEFVAYLKLLVRLQPSDFVWDIGCGCGLLELALESLGWTGRLIGTDIHRPSIAWANRTIAARVPTFSFVHADIFNAAYWPRGRRSADQWLPTFEPSGFDVVIAKSFFTHLLPDELRLYLDAVAQRLKPRGRALLTFFVLDAQSDDAATAGKAAFRFLKPSSDAPYAVRRLNAPTAGVAYEERFLREAFRRCGLRVTDIHYGIWSGRGQGLSFQDIAVLEKD